MARLNISFKRIATLVLFGAAAFLCTSVFAQTSATTGTQLENGLKELITLLNGGVARALAVLAVIGFGIGALSGRVDWIKALQVIMAIGVIFSADVLVKMFAP